MRRIIKVFPISTGEFFVHALQLFGDIDLLRAFLQAGAAFYAGVGTGSFFELEILALGHPLDKR